MSVFAYDRAIVRRPSRSVSDGLRAGDHDGPTFEGVALEHAAYVAALEGAGLTVEVLPPLDDFPDSVFVEDAALVFPEGAIMLRPGAPSRAGEAAAMRPTLAERFDVILDLPGGMVDGGDVLVTPDEVLIGLSHRTDVAGAEAAVASLAELGYRGRIVTTPAGVLHFKTGCSLIDEDTVLVVKSLDDDGVFGGMRRVLVAEGEEPAANCLRINDVVLIAEGFPHTRELVERLGLATMALPVAEIGKIDAGLSCMSLRWKGREEQR